jgi:serine/threonine protein kinase
MHHDLKPGNILVSAKGAKLVDFGLAAQVDNPDATVTMAVMRTGWGQGLSLFSTLQEGYYAPGGVRQDQIFQ